MTAPEPAGPEAHAAAQTDAASPREQWSRPQRAGARWWLLAAAALLAGAGLGVAIAQATRPAVPAAGTEQVLPGGYFSRLHGPAALPWRLPSLSRPAKVVALKQFSGHPLVINFWASWCPPCRKEMPALEQAASALAGRVSFVGLDTQDERAAGLAFARRTGVTYPLATDNVQVYASYGVSGLPTTFFVSADGSLVGRQVGAMTQARLDALVHELFGIAVSP